MKFRFIKKRYDFGSFLFVCLIITIISVSKALYCLLNILFVISLYYFLEKAMATHSSTLAWKIPGRRSLVGCSPWGP